MSPPQPAFPSRRLLLLLVLPLHLPLCLLLLRAVLIVLLEVLTPHRNLLVVVVLYQLSSFRFMFNDATRAAWGGIDAGIRGLTSHPRCPGAVASVYDRLARGLRSLVKSKDELIAQQMSQERARTEGAGAGAAAGGVAGLLSKCSVM